MKISIVIPTYNRNDLLEKCLESLEKSIRQIDRNLYEVIVTDDSVQNTAKPLIETRFNWVTWISGPKRGPAANRNNGVSKASGEWILFTDDDCMPTEKWVSVYIEQMQANTAQVLEGKTVADRPRSRFDEVAPINTNGKKLWSCNFAITKSLFLQLNGFDETFPFSTMEDIDFYSRVAKQADILFLPDALVIHPWRQRKAFAHFTKRLRSQRYYAEKHNIKENFSFRISRLKIFIGGLFFNLKSLIQFSMRGWQAYFDKCAFDFCMIFL